MNDRELLELAAKAAGIEIYRWPPVQDDAGPLIETHRSPISLREWNPLTDDGDALRLAVKLKMLIDVTCLSARATTGPQETCEELQSDPYAATRRAIVRAAAEIGKESK